MLLLRSKRLVLGSVFLFYSVCCTEFLVFSHRKQTRNTAIRENATKKTKKQPSLRSTLTSIRFSVILLGSLPAFAFCPSPTVNFFLTFLIFYIISYIYIFASSFIFLPVLRMKGIRESRFVGIYRWRTCFAYDYFPCHPTMCSMIFNIDHSSLSWKEKTSVVVLPRHPLSSPGCGGGAWLTKPGRTVQTGYEYYY